jgi:hypothetical protein
MRVNPALPKSIIPVPNRRRNNERAECTNPLGLRPPSRTRARTAEQPIARQSMVYTGASTGSYSAGNT